MSGNCDVIVIFSIYNQFEAIRKPDSWCMVCKTYIFVNNNFLSFHSRDLTNNFSRFTNNLVVLLLLLLTNVPNYCLKI